MKRVFALLLSGMLVFTSVGTAMATEPSEEAPPVEEEFIATIFPQEVDAAYPVPSGPQSRAAAGNYFGKQLKTKFERDLYAAIVTHLEGMMEGEPAANYVRTNVKNTLNRADFDAAASNVFSALLKDHSDKLYWMDKPGKTNYGWLSNNDSFFLFPLREEYQGEQAGEIHTDNSPVPFHYILIDRKDGRVGDAKKEADRILEKMAEFSGMSDYDKVQEFNYMICTMTEYDDKAAQEGSPYDESSQWVGVFLWEPVTSRGYAGAFQYFCDGADIGCLIVEGTASDGKGGRRNHVWNYVELEGKWYLVDCTNNDGQGGELNYNTDLLAIGSDSEFYKKIAYNPDVIYDQNGQEQPTRLNPANDLLEKADYTPSADKYTIRVQGGEADMTQAAAGTIVTVTATGTGTFSHWSSSSSKGEFQDSGARETLFIMPNENVVITANYRDSGPIVDSGDPPYSGGGSGSANDDTPARTPTAPVEKAYTQAELQDKTADAVNRAIEKATAAGSKSGNATIILENPKNLTPELLKAIVDKAAQLSKEKGVTITPMVAIDRVVDGKIVSRIYIDPAKFPLTGEIVLDVTLGDAAVTTHFANYFTNTIKVVTLTPAGTLPAPLTLAVKMDLTVLDEKNLIFYTYDPATNSYSRIQKPNYRVDENGYVYLTSPTGGPILVTDKVMTAK